MGFPLSDILSLWMEVKVKHGFAAAAAAAAAQILNSYFVFDSRCLANYYS